MLFSSSRVLLFAASMMASSSATLAASAAPSCLEGDGACQGGIARFLLQSKTKLDLDQLTFILEDKDAMHSSGLISDETVDELQARAEAMVQNDQALSPLERTTLDALNKSLGEMLPTLQDGHSEDQAEIDVAVQLIKNCNKNFDDDAEAAKTAEREVNTSQNEHKDCRTEQSKLKAEAVKASGELDKFWKPLVLPQKPVVASQALMDSVEKWVKNNKKTLSEKLSKNATAYENLTKKAGDCKSKQSVLESGFCQWFGRATAANKSYSRCWTQSGSTFAKLKKEALASAEGRKFQYVSIHKIQCYMKVIFLPSRKSLNKCKDLSLDASIFNLTNTVAEPQKNVAGELGPMDSKPGDESWKQSVYGGLSGVANVTPCAVAHFCGSDERVLAHRCVACGPGEENQAGDDALGPNTNCTAVLCGANQYVSSNTCKPCAAGTTNNASDDASGADTSCTSILCDANQHVTSNRCDACPPGTINAAGDDASGGNTTCDAILCAQNQHVQAHACHACSAGKANAARDDASAANTACKPIKCSRNQHVKSNACHTCAAGKTNADHDDASGSDTHCTATKCSVNKKVVSNECKGCPPGKTNAAGDVASGVNTACEAVKCLANQHVQGHACKSCPDGTTNAAGDDASGPNTGCDAVKCGANQHVVSNGCTACPSGMKNAAGDDASGSDTSCGRTCALFSCPSGYMNKNHGSTSFSRSNCCQQDCVDPDYPHRSQHADHWPQVANGPKICYSLSSHAQDGATNNGCQDWCCIDSSCTGGCSVQQCQTAPQQAGTARQLTAAEIAAANCTKAPSYIGALTFSNTNGQLGFDDIPENSANSARWWCDFRVEGVTFDHVGVSYTLIALDPVTGSSTHADDNEVMTAWGADATDHNGYFSMGTPSTIINGGLSKGGNVATGTVFNFPVGSTSRTDTVRLGFCQSSKAEDFSINNIQISISGLAGR